MEDQAFFTEETQRDEEEIREPVEEMVPNMPERPVQKRIGKWAKPADFDIPKNVEVVNFQLLTVPQITAIDGRPPLFPPDPNKWGQDDKIRRFTFKDLDNGGIVRMMDVNAIKFQKQLASFGIKKGTVGTVYRVPSGKGFDWHFEKAV